MLFNFNIKSYFIIRLCKIIIVITNTINNTFYFFLFTYIIDYVFKFVFWNICRICLEVAVSA